MTLKKMLAMVIAFVISFYLPVFPVTSVKADVCVQGFGTAEKPFLLDSEEDLINITLLGGEKHYKMISDITLTAENWNPIPLFTGVFDGDGHTIRNLRHTCENPRLHSSVDTFGCSGFFRKLQNATVKNVNFRDGNISGCRLVGTVAARADGDCLLENITSDVVIQGNDGELGGIVGYAASVFPVSGTGVIIRRCANYGNIVSTNNVFGIGGIVGNAMGATITECYNSGSISGNSCVGGIAGELYNSNIYNCYSSGKVTAQNNAGGIVSQINYSGVYLSLSTCSVTGSYSVGGISASFVKGASASQNVAINSSLTGTSPRRISVANSGGTLSNNLAWDKLPVYVGSTLTYPTGTHSDANGQNTTLEDLKKQQTYENLGWDFTNIWVMSDTFPVLRWLADRLPPIEPPTTVTISPETTEMKVGETFTLSAIVLPESAPVKTVVWSSSNASVATVSETGIVTAITPGQVTITAALTDGSALDTCQITVSRSLELVRYNDNDSKVKYIGSWLPHINDPQFYSNDQHFTDNTSSYVEVTFQGARVDWIGATSNNLGISDVYIDNVLVQSVDLYSPSLETQKVLFSASDLTTGVHTIKIVPTGRKNDLSAGYYVTVDAFDCYEDEVVNNSFDVNDNSSEITYTGPWTYHNNDNTFFSNDQHFTKDISAYAEFTFTGTGVSWIGATSYNLGNAEIYIDGTLKQTIDLYSSNLQPQKILYRINGLTPGAHTIKIKPTGTKNDLSEDVYITIDAFSFES